MSIEQQNVVLGGEIMCPFEKYPCLVVSPAPDPEKLPQILLMCKTFSLFPLELFCFK